VPDSGTHAAENFIAGDDNVFLDIYLGHGPTALWVDGFESGDTSHWSAIAP
jgi:hypothetical protein